MFDWTNLVDNAINSLKTMIQNLLIDGITAEFNIISDILSSTSTAAGSRSEVLGQLVMSSPADWGGVSTAAEGTAAAAGGSVIWATVRTATEGIIVPIAGTIFGFIMIVDFIGILLNKNNFEYDGSEIMRWFLKYVAGSKILAHAYEIAPYLLQIGSKLSSGVAATSLDTITAPERATFESYEIGQLLLMFLIVFIVLLGVAALVVVIIASLCTRMIDGIMYLSVSPLATATFASDSWSSVGKSWAKGLVGIGVQGFFILVALMAEGAMLTSTVGTITTAADSSKLLFNLIVLLGVTGGLTMAVAKSGQLSKQIFGA